MKWQISYLGLHGEESIKPFLNFNANGKVVYNLQLSENKDRFEIISTTKDVIEEKVDLCDFKDEVLKSLMQSNGLDVYRNYLIIKELFELEEKLLNILYKSEYEEIPNSASYKFNYKKAAKELSEITTNVSIEFAEWISNIKLHGYSKQLHEAMIIHKVKTTKELFEIFIKNYYKN
jgi:hypothetical protein